MPPEGEGEGGGGGAGGSGAEGDPGFAVEGLEITERITRALERDGIREPFPVQLAAAVPLLEGLDATIQSGTGTGKTLAYLLPLLERLARGPAGDRLLVLAPSPELAIQILRVAERYKREELSSASLVGSGRLGRQVAKLRARPRILVGTPGRVLEVVSRRKLRPRELGALVLDEADRILSEEIDAELRRILSRPEVDPQIVLCSARLGERAEAFRRDCLRPGAARIALGVEPTRERIRHWVAWASPERKARVLLSVLQRTRARRALVFVAHIEDVARLWQAIARRGIRADGLSAERSKLGRKKALDAFREGKIRVLVSTDAAARGLDIAGVDWVIHHDAARDAETYLHRSGRTGRAGQCGDSLTLATARQKALVRGWAEELGIEFRPLAEARGRR